MILPRRKFLGAAAALGLLPAQHSLAVNEPSTLSATDGRVRKIIPSTGESLPAVGMGTWITFDVGQVPYARQQRASVLQTFFECGGSVIDSSPMYGHAEEVVGASLAQLDSPQVFAASKIWTPVSGLGVGQMKNSETLWGLKQMDLMAVHNLVALKKHLPQLLEWKAEGRIRYVGVTTSHGRRHKELEQVMRKYPLDFVQFTYNVDQTAAENRLLPLAADRGMAVMINRPFQRGHLFDKYAARPLPEIASSLGCSTWAEYFLLYVVSHPAVTCAIPATSRVDHMIENMRTLALKLPDQGLRREMLAQLQQG